ncbi:3-oxoacyl-[acyl-carrier-protein] reductase [Bombilactobacillus thymidiniphilus]|uniref:3-oxoacyl-[acyl-carrier-protein] reductase n=1 Tax=Bombilactobacillus thymidiniphilus TaxID=2923363 RepID=A0ABY4PFQ3_9LACO|nr:3-oxoacyl-[acyl-carrier-protein] reductase [Bombilactobacillus thymidiniphilus]UQS84351.1 3-oxoacyl-[acyl-carrier-protein] reductase [Bombilactobacillus thymidiniphilus]
MDLKDKVVLVTGSSRGIGLEVARAFAMQGANVVLNARKPIDATIIQQIKDLGVNCWDISANVTDVDSVKNLINSILEQAGHLDVVVNNAGIVRDGLLNRMSEEDFNSVVKTNLVGTFNVIRQSLRSMYKQRSGCFINMASVVGLTGNIGQANYAASKAGIIGLTKSVAQEVALRNLRCNAIAPGMIDTQMTQQLSDKRQTEIINQIPLKRFGQIKEVAATAVFLAQNDYITGQTITVDGGLTMQ